MKKCFEIVEGSKVTPNHIKQALALDLITYSDNFHLNLDTCLKYHKANNKIYTMLVKEKSVAGYVNFSPVSKKIFEDIKSGQFIDTVISPKDIMTYADKNVLYYGYLSSIVLAEQYRGKGYSNILIKHIVDKICSLAKQGIYFESIIADAISVQGEILCAKLGMKPYCATQHSSIIYEMTLTPLTMVKNNINEKIFLLYGEGKL